MTRGRIGSRLVYHILLSSRVVEIRQSRKSSARNHAGSFSRWTGTQRGFTPKIMNKDDENPLSMVSEPLSRAIGERYLTYALSTIMHRALPDARDGLKPDEHPVIRTVR